MRLGCFALAVGCAACAGERDGPAREPAPQFGRVTALLGTTPVVGAWGRDSVVAVYAPDAGTLQIDGARLSGRRLPTVRLMMSCAAPPAPGVYPVRGLGTSIHAEAYLDRGGRGAWWAPWSRRPADRAFLSDSTPPGVLELDTLDLAGGRVYGRFRMVVRSFNRVPAESLAATGTFWGRVRTVDFSRWRTHPLRWAPDMDRNCAAIRRPLPGATAAAVGAPTPHGTLKLSGTPGRPAPPPSPSQGQAVSRGKLAA